MTHVLPLNDENSGNPQTKRTGAPSPEKHPNLLRKPYFYDSQMKRLLVQLMSCFSGYQVRTGLQRDGKPRFMDVPIIYGDMSRAATYIINGGPDNTMAYLPIMSLFLTNIKQKADWRLNPQHFEKYNFIERARDPDGNLLVNVPGKKKTVERFQPVPYDVTFEVAIWSSNTDQLWQILEPILIVFNPDMDIQLSNSPADWTFLTTVTFDGDVNMEKAVPSGTEIDPLTVATLRFNTVLYLNPPVKVYDTTYIYEVKIPIKEIEEGLDFDSFETMDGLIIRADDDDIIKFESFN